MLYYVIKIFIQLYNRVYFKRMYISGEEHIPKAKPALIAANHPNGFLDGTIVTSLTKKATLIFVRGDVFKKAWSNRVLRSLKLIPIFRVRDGEVRESVVQNNRSYDQLYDLFQKDQHVMIFPEGDSAPEKRLRTLRKGTARIVNDMEGRNDKQLTVAVVPLGINYSFYQGFGKELFLNFQEPIFLNDFREEGKSDSHAMNMFTRALHTRLKELVVHVPLGYETLAETGFDVLRAEQTPVNRLVVKNNQWFKQQHRLAELLQDEAQNGTSVLTDHLRGYQTIREKHQLPRAMPAPGALKLMLSLIWFVPSVLSWFIFKLSFEFGKRIADRTIKKMELYDSVMYGIGMAINLVLDLVMLIGLLITGAWLGALLYYAFRWQAALFAHIQDTLLAWNNGLIWKKFSKNLPEDAASLQTHRKAVLEAVQSGGK